MTLAKDMAKDKHDYSTGITYDRHLQPSKYFYSTDIWSTSTGRKKELCANGTMLFVHFQLL
jgi:hypothetical protein